MGLPIHPIQNMLAIERDAVLSDARTLADALRRTAASLQTAINAEDLGTINVHASTASAITRDASALGARAFLVLRALALLDNLAEHAQIFGTGDAVDDGGAQ